jgi:hypothetical protein
MPQGFLMLCNMLSKYTRKIQGCLICRAIPYSQGFTPCNEKGMSIWGGRPFVQACLVYYGLYLQTYPIKVIRYILPHLTTTLSKRKFTRPWATTIFSPSIFILL